MSPWCAAGSDFPPRYLRGSLDSARTTPADSSRRSQLDARSRAEDRAPRTLPLSQRERTPHATRDSQERALHLTRARQTPTSGPGTLSNRPTSLERLAAIAALTKHCSDVELSGSLGDCAGRPTVQPTERPRSSPAGPRRHLNERTWSVKPQRTRGVLHPPTNRFREFHWACCSTELCRRV